MVLEKLGDALKGTLDKITNALFVDEKLINELVKDIQRALLQSDVNVKMVFDLTKKIKERALKDEPPAGMTKKEHLIKIVYDELVIFLGGSGAKVEITKKPFIIMLVGLFGNGKTTTAGKLGKYFLKRGNKVALISLDVWRPAAYEQLFQLGKQLNITVYGNPKQKNPTEIYKEFETEFKKYDVLIFDTAGRDALSQELISELEDINKLVKPDESLLIIGADVGQTAEKQAQAFHDTCKITGVIITKMDGTAKGGGALIACAITKAPVKFIGIGEKVDDFEHFEPERFVGRLLGMGDLQSLLEKAREAISEEDAEDMSKRLLKGDFTLIDLYDQMRAMNKMGPLTKIMELIPGFSQVKLPKEALQVQEGKLKKWKFIMNSMTQSELEEPDDITSKRIDRISKGSGTSHTDVKELLKQYEQAKKMAKMMRGGNLQKMMKKMGGKLPGM